ncbi:hypothetical protein [Mycolicibacterium thermoresistibile]
MLTRLLIGAATAAALATPAVAAAEPAPPAPPDVNAFEPVKLSEYAVMEGAWYAFSIPGEITCVLQRSGGYGCSGPLPAAPGGANLVSGGPGAPGFANTDASVLGVVEGARPLPPGSRISYQTVSCGTDGTMTACVDSRTGAGFVISPAGSYTLAPNNPLLDRRN